MTTEGSTLVVEDHVEIYGTGVGIKLTKLRRGVRQRC
jgi:hypothetical protein